MPENGMPRATILVAHESEEDRELLSRLLVAQGYRVLCAEDAVQALEFVATQPIDLVLIDAMMPHRTGFAICRAIKSRPETRLIPVVLATSLTGTEDRVRGMESGADDFLNKPVRKEELLARVRSLVLLKHFTDELENAETVLITLARSIEAKDPYTEGHCDRIARCAAALGGRLGLSEEQRVALRRAGIVHDIGKVAVPEHILFKPGPLDDDERRIMQTHPLIAERICAPLKSFRQVLPIIRQHHEKLDGSGYPDGLGASQLLITSRILPVADVFDALTNSRPYREALSVDQAIVILREEVRKGWWDPNVLTALEDLLRAQPESFRGCAA
ncbi:MAG TPA: HD domain-containing phosphohydrolase [Candidatus Acidoferrales bacterium]|jgi:putative two-component system response regulator|nr:HD domain-containing phosphohydrolase [Candidatus Acidoferrales bacterium]